MRFAARWLVQDAADGGSGGGGAPAAAPVAAPAPNALQSQGEAPVAAGTAAKPASALQAATTPPEEKFFGLPEKLRVMKADGSLDLEASAKRSAESYAQLERQMGAAGGPPPQSPGDYKIAAPEHLKDLFQPEDQGFREFLTEAHKMGMSQKQLDAAMAHYFKSAEKLVAGAAQLSTDECMAELGKVWTDPQESASNFQAAARAFRAFGGERAAAIMDRYGNDPDAIWLMAQVGKSLREDPAPAAPGAQERSAGVQALMASEAYTNPKHPEHAIVSERVRKHFEQQYAGQAMANIGTPSRPAAARG